MLPASASRCIRRTASPTPATYHSLRWPDYFVRRWVSPTSTTLRPEPTSLIVSGGRVWHGLATTVLVELLLQREIDGDQARARLAIDQLDGATTGSVLVLHKLALLYVRALLARSDGDAAAYRDYRDRYRKMASELNFEGHMAVSGEMP